jgi:hypothetical protein
MHDFFEAWSAWDVGIINVSNNDGSHELDYIAFDRCGYI